ncbi:MAG: glycosyltransferase family 2 protein [Clostridiales bacterium]|nr:glycosyltransferase family 2 protein [Clostridiales bacterium]
MEIFRGTLEVLVAVFGGLVMIFMLYQVILSIFGFTKNGKDYEDQTPQTRFLVLVPAHNEESVIGDIVKNLQQMEYPSHLYDYYVIADNCTDSTAQVVESLGGKVIVTQKEGPDAPTGKPIALKKALDYLGDYEKKHDLLMIFDADNLIDTNMFAEVNSQYISKDKPEMIQCYLGCKNNMGIIPWFFYTSFSISNRFFQLSRYKRGINCSIGGTGFAISTAYLKERGGWTTLSLTEDFEIQVEATLEKKRILWNQQVRVYDEKPRQIKASYKQLVRWAQGRWFVTFNNTGKLFRAVKNREISFREGLSVFTFMYTPISYFVAIFQVLAQIILNITAPAIVKETVPIAKRIVETGQQGGWLMTIVAAIVFVYSYFFLFYIADYLDNGMKPSWRTFPYMIGSFLTNMVLATLAQVEGIFKYKDQNNWVKTEHFITTDAEGETHIGYEKMAVGEVPGDPLTDIPTNSSANEEKRREHTVSPLSSLKEQTRETA